MQNIEEIKKHLAAQGFYPSSTFDEGENKMTVISADMIDIEGKSKVKMTVERSGSKDKQVIVVSPTLFSRICAKIKPDNTVCVVRNGVGMDTRYAVL